VIQEKNAPPLIHVTVVSTKVRHTAHTVRS